MGQKGGKGMDNGRIIQLLARELGRTETQIGNVVRLLDEGSTIPFIARYRKELHGTMDDTALRTLEERLGVLRRLAARREEISALIDGQGKLTEELSRAIEQAETLAALEDIYRPYRPKRRTRATAAQEKGLGPLADRLYTQARSLPEPLLLAEDFVDPEKGICTAEEALQGASDIIAERISDDASLRGVLRRRLREMARLCSKAAGEQDSVYRTYYGFEQPAARILGYQVLAVNRGEREGFLKVSFQYEHAPLLTSARQAVVQPGSAAMSLVRAACDDACERLIFPSLERELRSALTDEAAEGAIRNFALNLRPLLMQPPVRGKVTLGFDPAYRTGCKLAAVDPTGKVLETGVIYPTPPHNKTAEAEKTLRRMILRHGITAIAIGNGTASRESEQFVAGVLSRLRAEGTEVGCAIVNEAGASVYSASRLGAEEFPDYDVSLRSAVSIARRLQDPLAELVKIDPQSIGVGQYQHDLPQQRLSETLGGVVEDCVNAVGVNVNTASAELLRRVSGISSVTARNIVAYREENGPFTSRRQLLKVPKLGPKAFEQCAGFLRIPSGKEPLDNTGIHPESYAAAGKLIQLLGYCPEQLRNGALPELPDRLAAYGPERAAEICGTGVPTLQDIAAELRKPGRDPRDDLPQNILRSDVQDIESLRPGMILQGTVRNVIDFGAFVDIGVHQDGLVHISQICSRFIRHPSEVLSVGDTVRVMVLDVDVKRNRISLTMKIPADRENKVTDGSGK